MSEGPSSGATPPGVGDQSSPPRPKGGSHRATRSPFALILPTLVVAASVVAVGVGVYGWVTALDQPEDLSDVAPIVSEPTTTGAPSPSKSPKPSHSPKASHSAEPSSSPTHSRSPGASPTHSPKPSHTAKQTSPAVARDYPVVVLNQTSVTGLAAATAADLRRLGWTVTGVGNWRGDIAQTTVYYPPGRYAQAQQLAHDVGTDRIRPRVSPMRADRLTVILAGHG